MSYKTFKVSEETSPDLTRALWMAHRLNVREGIAPRDPIPSQHEAFGRILREWSAITLGQVSSEPGFDVLCRADWRCESCGSSGLGTGGLKAEAGQARCYPCLARPEKVSQKG